LLINFNRVRKVFLLVDDNFTVECLLRILINNRNSYKSFGTFLLKLIAIHFTPKKEELLMKKLSYKSGEFARTRFLLVETF